MKTEYCDCKVRLKNGDWILSSSAESKLILVTNVQSSNGTKKLIDEIGK